MGFDWPLRKFLFEQFCVADEEESRKPVSPQSLKQERILAEELHRLALKNPQILGDASREILATHKDESLKQEQFLLTGEEKSQKPVPQILLKQEQILATEEEESHEPVSKTLPILVR